MWRAVGTMAMWRRNVDIFGYLWIWKLSFIYDPMTLWVGTCLFFPVVTMLTFIAFHCFASLSLPWIMIWCLIWYHITDIISLLYHATSMVEAWTLDGETLKLGEGSLPGLFLGEFQILYCVYIYVYVYIYMQYKYFIHTYIHTYIYIYIYIYICVNVYIYIHIYQSVAILDSQLRLQILDLWLRLVVWIGRISC